MSDKPEINGYCPVAYLLADKPLMGDPQYTSTYKGSLYYLVSEDAKKKFESNPEKYIPAFGGNCAFGMSINEKFEVDPTSYKIVNGKILLFLKNAETDALQLWNNENEDEILKKAELNFKG